jgi:hypothetical protein
MTTPVPKGQHQPNGVRSLELQRRARVIANFAEYLAEDVRGHPDRARDAMGVLAEWCEGDPKLLAQARSEVLRHRQREQMATVENNRHAVLLLDFAASAS